VGLFRQEPAWRRDLRFRVLDILDNTNSIIRTIGKWDKRMSADRDLLAAMAVAVGAISAAVDNLVTDRDQWRSRALAAEGAAATDEADDVTAAQPVQDALAAVMAKLAPVAPPAADPDDDSAELPPIEDVPAAVDAAPDPVADGPQPSDDGESPE
jgi:hypothetical protein